MSAAQDPVGDSRRFPTSGKSAVVIGGGVAGLTAALELLRLGRSVTVLEAADRPGGLVARHTVAGIDLDAGAESFSIRGKAVAKLATELNLGDSIAAPLDAPAWLYRAQGAVPLPKAGILGIPATPLASDVVAVIGWGGALRAQLDRLMPVLRIGKYKNLAALVRGRMGAKVLDQLVAPVASGVYTTDVEQLDVDRVAPGLNLAITNTGSLSGGVMQLRESAPAGSQVAGLDGGIYELVIALVKRVEALGGTISTGTAAASVAILPAAAETSGIVDAGAAGAAGAIPGPQWVVRTADGSAHTAHELVVATESATALALLTGTSPALGKLADAGWPEGPKLELVTLVLSGEDARLEPLRAAPRGSGVLVAKGSTVTAKALTHATAKWPWLAARTSDHVIRLSYGRGEEAPETAGLTDAAVRELAVADASALLGVEIPSEAVKGLARTPLRNSPPAGLTGQRERVASVTAAQKAHNHDAALPGLALVGAWLSGTGLAQVVPHARTAVEKLVTRAVAAEAAEDR